MSQQYSAVVVGLGRIGALYPSEKIPRTHVAAYMDNKNVRMIAGIDPNPEARLKFRELWGDGIKLFPSISEMLSAGFRPDIVSICTTPSILQKNIRDFSNYKPKMYFLEKPAVSSERQSKELLDAIGDTPVAMNYHRCWDPRHKLFFEKINKSKIFSVRVLYSKGLLNYASHMIALLVQNFGEVSSVSKCIKGQDCQGEKDHSYSFSLHFKQGFNAIFQGVNDINYDLLETDVITDLGIYSLKSGGCRQSHEKPVKGQFYPNYSSLADSLLDTGRGQVEGLSQAVENIVNFMNGKVERIECDLKCGLNTFQIMNQVKNLHLNENTKKKEGK